MVIANSMSISKMFITNYLQFLCLSFLILSIRHQTILFFLNFEFLTFHSPSSLFSGSSPLIHSENINISQHFLIDPQLSSQLHIPITKLFILMNNCLMHLWPSDFKVHESRTFDLFPANSYVRNVRPGSQYLLWVLSHHCDSAPYRQLCILPRVSPATWLSIFKPHFLPSSATSQIFS